MSAERRSVAWRKLVEELRTHVAAAHADPFLRADGPSGGPDVYDRKETCGERIIGLCKKLSSELVGTQEFNRILASIGLIADGDARADYAALKRLSGMKRLPTDYDYQVAFHIQHLRLVAGQMHHIAA
jgi:hypothetical protein